MTPPNPMMQALQQSRQSNPVSSSGAMPAGPAQTPPADMQKYWSMIQDMSAKLDKVLEALSANYTGKTPDKTETKENENEPASGY